MKSRTLTYIIMGVAVWMAEATASASHFDLAVMYANQGKCQQSLQHAAKIDEVNLKYAALVNVGSCFMRENLYRDAISAFIEAYTTDPSKDFAPGLLALAYFYAGQGDLAKKWIENALEMKGPNYYRWALVAGMIYPKLGMWEKVFRLKQEVSKHPDAEAQKVSTALEVLSKERVSWVNYFLRGKLGLLFDSNPGLYPEEERQIVSVPVNDFVSSFYATGDVSLVRLKFLSPGLRYTFYQNIHAKADRFDFQLHKVALTLRSKWNNAHIFAQGGYNIAYYSREFNPYLEGGFVDLYAEFDEGGWGYFLGGGYRKTAYYESVPIISLDRDASLYYLLLGFSFDFKERVAQIRAHSKVFANSAEQDEWTYLGFSLNVDFILRLFAKRLLIYAGAVGEIRAFTGESLLLLFDEKRLDFEYGADLRVRFNVKPWVFVAGVFTFRRADSNVNLYYDYTRYVTGVEVGFEYF